VQLEAIAKKLTYRTIQVTEPAKFELAERAVTEPPPGKLRMRIEACGVYRSDIFAAQGDAVTAGFGMAAVGFANHTADSGASINEHLEENVAATTLNIDANEMQELSEVAGAS